MNSLPLFQEFETLARNVPFVPLGTYPTPVQRLANLQKELGLESLWIKRDDLTSDFYGGNKVRSLEFSLALACERKAELVVVYSAVGSNWPLACVVHARRLGLPTDVYFFPFPMDEVKRKNLAAVQKLARRVVSARSLVTFAPVFLWKVAQSARRMRVYRTPPGGVSPTTTLGYVNAVLELKAQVERGELPRPDYIFCPLGSGGTAAGLAIGLQLVGWPTRLIAVRVVDRLVANKWRLLWLIRQTLGVLARTGVHVPLRRAWDDILCIDHRCIGKGYSRPTPEAETCIALLRSHENCLLDVAYTGKAFCAILNAAQDPTLRRKHLLFWHTLNSRPLDELEGKLLTERA